jgi:hypothetical protein
MVISPTCHGMVPSRVDGIISSSEINPQKKLGMK